VQADYDFSSIALDEGRTNSHNINLGIMGRLARNLTFSSRSSYHITDVGGTQPAHGKGYDLRGDLYWNIARFSINVGASDIAMRQSSGPSTSSSVAALRQRYGLSGPVNGMAGDAGSSLWSSAAGGMTATQDAGLPVDLRATSFYSNVSAPLALRMFFTLSSSYTTDSAGESIIDIHTILNWYFRQVTVMAEYEMYKVSGGLSPVRENRIFVRLTRRFEKLIRPFW
jgi:hypothetical protein